MGGRPKNWRTIGSSKYASRTGTWVVLEMFTTAGVTRVSIGASDGIGWPSIAAGKVAARPAPGSVPNAITTAVSNPVNHDGTEGWRDGMRGSLAGVSAALIRPSGGVRVPAGRCRSQDFTSRGGRVNVLPW